MSETNNSNTAASTSSAQPPPPPPPPAPVPTEPVAWFERGLNSTAQPSPIVTKQG